MKIALAALSAITAVLLGFLSMPAVSQRVTNYEAKGNLAPTHDIDCVESSKVQNKFTPADLYHAMEQCLHRSEMAKAVFLYAIAGVYALFDTLRVKDVTAHDANAVLTQQSFANLDDARKQEFKAAMAETADNSSKLAELCAQIRRIGPPNYFPAYMTQHGMAAFTGQNQGLVENFDGAAAWEKSLGSYLHCPPR